MSEDRTLAEIEERMLLDLLRGRFGGDRNLHARFRVTRPDARSISYSPNFIRLSKRYRVMQEDLRYDDRFEIFERKLDDIHTDVKDIKSTLSLKEDKKDEAIIEYKDQVSAIQGVLMAYCKQTSETLSLWALIDKEKISDTLSKVVQIQIELYTKFPHINFDFQIDPLIDKNELDTENWNPLVRRES